jgi:hypothetical protein
MLRLVSRKDREIVRIEVFTEVKVKTTLFLNLTQCSMVNSYHRLVANYCLHFETNSGTNIPAEKQIWNWSRTVSAQEIVRKLK